MLAEVLGDDLKAVERSNERHRVSPAICFPGPREILQPMYDALGVGLLRLMAQWSHRTLASTERSLPSCGMSQAWF